MSRKKSEADSRLTDGLMQVFQQAGGDMEKVRELIQTRPDLLSLAERLLGGLPRRSPGARSPLPEHVHGNRKRARG